MPNSELIQKLKELKKLEAAGRPQESWVVSSREILMSQISPLMAQREMEPAGNGIYYWQYAAGIFQQRILRPAMATVAAFVLLIVYTAAFSIANTSLPGDALYPVKTAQEKMQLAFTFSDDQKLQLQMDFVSRRVDELQQITDKSGNAKDQKIKVAIAVKKISEEVKSVQDRLNKIKMASVNSPVSETTETSTSVYILGGQQATSTQATSTLLNIIGEQQELQSTIASAKSSLDKGDVDSALNKIQEINGIVEQVVKTAETTAGGSGAVSAQSNDLNSSSTIILNSQSNQVEATTTGETSETTRTLLTN